MNMVGKVVAAIVAMISTIVTIALLYSPFLTISNSINQTQTNSNVTSQISAGQIAFGVTVVLIVGGIVLWLFVSMHQREYEEDWRR